MAEIPSYRYGRIIYAYLRSSKTGKKERHPAVILNGNNEIIQPEHIDPRRSQADNSIFVIGVSTKHKTYRGEYVQLPFSIRGHAGTKLKEDCGAIIGWYHRIVIPDDVIGFGGDVPTTAVHEIDRAIRNDLARKIGGEFRALSAIFEELLGEHPE